MPLLCFLFIHTSKDSNDLPSHVFLLGDPTRFRLNMQDIWGCMFSGFTFFRNWGVKIWSYFSKWFQREIVFFVGPLRYSAYFHVIHLKVYTCKWQPCAVLSPVHILQDELYVTSQQDVTSLSLRSGSYSVQAQQMPCLIKRRLVRGLGNWRKIRFSPVSLNCVRGVGIGSNQILPENKQH